MKRALVATEFQEQAALFAWWATYCRTVGVDERLLMASCGGAYLAGDAKHRAIQAGKLKRAGYQVGTPDLFLAVPKSGGGECLFHGLFIELKRKGGGATIAQQLFLDVLRRQGYNCVLAQGADEAMKAIKVFLDLATPI